MSSMDPTKMDQSLDSMPVSPNFEPNHDKAANSTSVLVVHDQFDENSAESSWLEKDTITDDSSSEISLDSKWLRSAPKEWEPFLDSFTLLPKLPLEIRQAIWKWTLKPRVIESEYRDARGFFSTTKTPVTTRVCRESRDTVKHWYPVFLGNIFNQPNIIFNSSLDTLYFDLGFSNDTNEFLVSLKEDELKQIRHIAVDQLVQYYGEFSELEDAKDIFRLFSKATQVMPSLKEFLVVYKLGPKCWHDHGFPEGNGPMHLYEDFLQPVQAFMFNEGIHLGDEDAESECQELPNSEYLLEGFDVTKSRSVWGWRPTTLPMNDYSWHH